MVRVCDQPTTEGQDPPTDDQIRETVLGKRRGYIRGLGTRMAPTTSSFESDARAHSVTAAVQQENVALCQRLDSLEERYSELQTLV